MLDRRQFLAHATRVSAAVASASWLGPRALAGLLRDDDLRPHHAARAQRLVWVVLEGGCSQLDLFDEKPALRELHGRKVDPAMLEGLSLPAASRGKELHWAAPVAPFRRHGASGMALSEMLPRLGGIADRIGLLRSLRTDALDHPGAQQELLCGATPGSPSLAEWIGYALDGEHRDLPAFVTLGASGRSQPGFLPPRVQGLALHRARPMLQSPPGIDAEARAELDDAIRELDRLHHRAEQDPSILRRIERFDRARRVQSLLPSLADLGTESPETLRLYGAAKDRRNLGSDCLTARRLCEAGVRVVQVHHAGWDHDRSLASRLPAQAAELDQALSGLLLDLDQRGLLEDTLVVCASEFGRSPWALGPLGGDWGRDHHPLSAALVAGAQVPGGTLLGETDAHGLHVTADPITLRDLQATILHILGIDGHALRVRHGGRDVSPLAGAGQPVEALLG